ARRRECPTRPPRGRIGPEGWPADQSAYADSAMPHPGRRARRDPRRPRAAWPPARARAGCPVPRAASERPDDGEQARLGHVLDRPAESLATQARVLDPAVWHVVDPPGRHVVD